MRRLIPSALCACLTSAVAAELAGHATVLEPVGRRELALLGRRLEPCPGPSTGSEERDLADVAGAGNDLFSQDSLDASGLVPDPLGRVGLSALVPSVEARSVVSAGAYTVLSFPCE